MAQGAGGATVRQLVPGEALEVAEQGAVLLDVREPEEWEAGHAPGAQHVPLGLLGEQLGALPTAAELVVVCRSGGRSQIAADALGRVGFRAHNLAGGMQAWAAAGLPVVTDDGAPGTVL